MSSVTAPSVPSVNLGAEFFNGILNVIKSQLSQLTADEVKACAPAFITFFTWVKANPTAVSNPVLYTPQLAVLQAEVLAAQQTVISEVVQSGAGQMITLFQNLLKGA